MAFNSDRSRLFVANANSDTVSVIDTATDRVVETISVKAEGPLPFGSAPNALAVSSDDSTLWVANGTDNAICVVSLGIPSATGRAHGTGQSRQRLYTDGLVPQQGFAG